MKTAAACLGVTAAGFAAMPAAEAATTRVVRLDPYAAEGSVAPGYRVAKTAPGEAACDIRSYRAQDTYQCSGESSGSYQTCWVTPAEAEDEALCLTSPYSRRATRLRLAEPPSEPPLRGRFAPWGMTLLSGKRCTLIGGATTVIRGRRLNYGCSRTVFLLGEPRKSSSRMWRILGAKLTKSGPVAGKTARVKVAYYGAGR